MSLESLELLDSDVRQLIARTQANSYKGLNSNPVEEINLCHNNAPATTIANAVKSFKMMRPICFTRVAAQQHNCIHLMEKARHLRSVQMYEIRNKTLFVKKKNPAIKGDYISAFSQLSKKFCTGLHLFDDWYIKLPPPPPPLPSFTLQEQHVTRWEGLLAVPRRWSSTCQGLASVIYEASQPQPSPRSAAEMQVGFHYWRCSSTSY